MAAAMRVYILEPTRAAQPSGQQGKPSNSIIEIQEKLYSPATTNKNFGTSAPLTLRLILAIQ
jgi:hypothetical protein